VTTVRPYVGGTRLRRSVAALVVAAIAGVAARAAYAEDGQLAVQSAGTTQLGAAAATAAGAAPTNVVISVRVDSPGDGAPVQQTSAVGATGVAANNAATRQGVDEQGGLSPQVSAEDATAGQTAAADATAAAAQPTNIAISVRVDSPGDDAPVVQQSDVAATGAAANGADTTQQAGTAETPAAAPAAQASAPVAPTATAPAAVAPAATAHPTTPSHASAPAPAVAAPASPQQGGAAAASGAPSAVADARVPGCVTVSGFGLEDAVAIGACAAATAPGLDGAAARAPRLAAPSRAIRTSTSARSAAAADAHPAAAAPARAPTEKTERAARVDDRATTLPAPAVLGPGDAVRAALAATHLADARTTLPAAPASDSLSSAVVALALLLGLLASSVGFAAHRRGAQRRRR
jgi:hypothetical protein